MIQNEILCSYARITFIKSVKIDRQIMSHSNRIVNHTKLLCSVL